MVIWFLTKLYFFQKEFVLVKLFFFPPVLRFSHTFLQDINYLPGPRDLSNHRFPPHDIIYGIGKAGDHWWGHLVQFPC